MEKTIVQLDPGAKIYNQLPIDVENEIRLLLLHSGRPDDKIECSLVVRHREHVFDEYYALSYTWGASEGHRTITVNGVPGVAVTDNLFAALRRVRDLVRTRTLWVDAVSINQNDSIERSAQVQRMCQVYSSADRVLVWLGDSDDMENIPAARFKGDLASLKDEWFRRSLYQAVRETTPSWWERIWGKFLAITHP